MAAAEPTLAATHKRRVYRLRLLNHHPVAPPRPVVVHVISSDTPPIPNPPPLSKRRCLDSLASALENSHGRTWFREGFLGKGSFGCVSLASKRSTSGQVINQSKLAVKSAPLNDSKTLQRERLVLAQLQSSRYVVGCYGDEVTVASDGDKVYNLILEYCSGLSLASRVKAFTKLPESEVAAYAHDVLMGLNHMHAKGFIHYDIKPDNILLVPVPRTQRACGFMAKIADFGLTKDLKNKEDGMGIIRGTFRYMSPELVKDKMVGYKLDIWALGCTVLELLTGERPWSWVDGNDAILSQIGRMDTSDEVPDISDLDFVSSSAREFLEKCLAPNSKRRWCASMLLMHPFVTRYDL